MALKEFLALVRKIKILEGLNDENIMKLVGVCEEKTLAENEYLFHEGDESDGIYMVLNGNVKILTGDTLIALISKNGIVGEMGVFSGQRRSADALAIETSEVLFLSLEKIEAFVNSDVKSGLTIYRNVIRILSHYLREQNFIMEVDKMLDNAFENLPE